MHEEIRRLADDDSKLVSAAATDRLQSVLLQHPSERPDQQSSAQPTSPPNATAGLRDHSTASKQVPAPTPGPVIDAEASAALEELYTQGLAALYTDRWDEAIGAFRAIVARDRGYKSSQAKLEQARRGQHLSSLYATAAATEDLKTAIERWEAVVAADSDYRDAPTRLAQARHDQAIAQLRTEAAELYRANQWQAVVSVGERLRQLAPDTPDPDGLIASAQTQLNNAKRDQTLAGFYRQAVHHMEAGKWRLALESLTELHRIGGIGSSFKDSLELAARAHRELTRTVAAIGRARLSTTIAVPKAATAVAFNTGGTQLAVAHQAKSALIVDLSGVEQHRLRHGGWMTWIWDVVYSPDGRFVATAGEDKTARIWDTATGTELLQITHGDQVRGVAFSPDGQRLATASIDKTARIWDATTGTELLRIAQDQALGVAFSPDGRFVATASADKTARIWHATTGTELLQITHGDQVRGVAFSPDGQRLATASIDKTARIWDATTGTELLQITHSDQVRGVAFSPDGRFVATASADKTARIWDATTGTEGLRGTHTSVVWGVAFSPDGRYFASCGDDRTVQLWHLREDE
uniref:High-affnity carbon uptake protein Hat/HatR n=1 Tax=Nonomuraea gerenzanensis TaxID=93944 RepID=A0A1M4BLC8_9ACTN|nr:High-affnity carbon uptake protein Hat/HatR [Nonomuraea gerenzanensis]